MMRNTKLDEAAKISDRIAQLQRGQTDLLKQLDQSLKIQSIWPDAFKHGSVGLNKRGKFNSRFSKKGMAIYCAYLRDRDDNRHYLTTEQFATLSPDDPIHPDWKMDP